jgi:hypothetical protein
MRKKYRLTMPPVSCWYLPGLFSYTEDGGYIFFRNASTVPEHLGVTAQKTTVLKFTVARSSNPNALFLSKQI